MTSLFHRLFESCKTEVMAIGRESEEKLKMKSEKNNNRTKEGEKLPTIVGFFEESIHVDNFCVLD